MALVLLGINHNTANVSLREQVAFPPVKMADAMQRVTALEHVREAVIVSTCNRTELYVDVDLGGLVVADAEGTVVSQDQYADPERLQSEQHKLLNWLSQYHGVDVAELSTCSYFHWRDDVIRHLMRVACGLDSMVLGEPPMPLPRNWA